MGAITFGVAVLAALAALNARESHRVHMADLGHPGAVPVPKQDYDRLRAQTLAEGAIARG